MPRDNSMLIDNLSLTRALCMEGGMNWREGWYEILIMGRWCPCLCFLPQLWSSVSEAFTSRNSLEQLFYEVPPNSCPYGFLFCQEIWENHLRGNLTNYYFHLLSHYYITLYPSYGKKFVFFFSFWIILFSMIYSGSIHVLVSCIFLSSWIVSHII